MDMETTRYLRKTLESGKRNGLGLSGAELEELKVACQYPHYHPVIKKCSVPETRFKIEKAFQSRCVDHNTKIIEDLVKLRQRQADLLGYPNHAAYKQEVKMAKNPENVRLFLETLSPKLQTLWQKEREVILKYKEEDIKAMEREFNGKINKEDFWYYITAIQEREFNGKINKEDFWYYI